jgi:hypothetical protein
MPARKMSPYATYTDEGCGDAVRRNMSADKTPIKAIGMAARNTVCKPKRVLKAAPPKAPSTPVKP